MNSLFSMFFLLVFFSEPQVVMEEFHQLNSEKEEIVFIDKYVKDSNPSVQAYVCAIEMKQAEYSFNPVRKLSVFNKAKKKLNLLIVTNPKNIDLRYIRLFIQEQTPRFLGYKDRIEEDKKFLKTKIKAKEISKKLEAYIYNNTSL